MSNKKVFVGGLPIDAKEDDIKDAFRRHNLNVITECTNFMQHI